MKTADIDPSLRSGEPAPDRLDDGFSPPRTDAPSHDGQQQQQSPAPPALGSKSPF